MSAEVHPSAIVYPGTVLGEQAKGMLAERSQIDMDEAFEHLRRYARSTNRQLTAVAVDVIAGTLPPRLLSANPSKRR